MTLVVSPKRVMNVWASEIERHTDGSWNVLKLDSGNSVKKLAQLDEFVERWILGSGAAPWIVIVNYESFIRDQLKGGFYQHGKFFSHVVLDESHRIKAAGSKISRALFAWRKAQSSTLRRICLTGTPLPNGPLDIYGQARFIDHTLFDVPTYATKARPDEGVLRGDFEYIQLGTNYAKFEGYFAVTVPQQNYNLVVGYRNQDHFKWALEQFMYVVKADDVLDLPAVVDNYIHVDLPPRVRAAYDALEKFMVAEIDEGTLVADHVLTRVLRLQALTGGIAHKRAFERSVLPEIEAHDVHRLSAVKIDAVTAIIEELAGLPVVIFARFTEELVWIRETLTIMGVTNSELSGKEDTLKAWQDGETQALVAQISSGAEGIDLSRANHAIYYSISYSSVDFEQSLARIRGPRSIENRVFYDHLIARDTIDEAVYNALKAKREMSASVFIYLRDRGNAPFLSGRGG